MQHLGAIADARSLKQPAVLPVTYSGTHEDDNGASCAAVSFHTRPKAILLSGPWIFLLCGRQQVPSSCGMHSSSEAVSLSTGARGRFQLAFLEGRTVICKLQDSTQIISVYDSVEDTTQCPRPGATEGIRQVQRSQRTPRLEGLVQGQTGAEERPLRLGGSGRKGLSEGCDF